MNGFELYIKIREQDPKAKICFFLQSQRYKDFRKTRLVLGKTINEDYFIQKPIKTEDKKLTSMLLFKLNIINFLIILY